MSSAEVAVAKSPIEVWRRIAQGTQEHALILEDDVWFHPSFARHLDQAWKDILTTGGKYDGFDVLYVSYMEATHVLQVLHIEPCVQAGARAVVLVGVHPLPTRCREASSFTTLPWSGRSLDQPPVQRVERIRNEAHHCPPKKRRLLNQLVLDSSDPHYDRRDRQRGAALFNARPTQLPVFAFGSANSGQSSLAMALSMLGYRCCSDLEGLPFHELKRLREGSVDRVFGAYVNVGCLEQMVEDLRRSFPQAKFIVTASPSGASSQVVQGILASLEGADVIVLDTDNVNAWRILCEQLRCVPPISPFPRLEDLGQRQILESRGQPVLAHKRAIPKWDRSPWVVEPDHRTWLGIRVIPQALEGEANCVNVDDGSWGLDPLRWSLRSDTFTGNLALFRPLNVESDGVEGAMLHVRREELGVRQYSAGALTSHADYLFGRFEATFQASDVPGVITGFFLHRNSPHQEIDIEIAGNMPNRLLVNVFYNPGDHGAQFDYGYRGSPSHIELGFDASRGMHRYAIEWTPCEIRWLVDDLLVHRRVLWDPTPIPHLPMKLHFNAWPPRSSHLAGRLNPRRLPATAHVHSIRARAHGPSALEQEARVVIASDGPVICGTSI